VSDETKLISIRAAAERLGVSYTFLWREIRAGKLLTAQLGSQHRISELDLTAYIEARRVPAK
jgi:excisionase family DNA binding protein